MHEIWGSVRRVLKPSRLGLAVLGFYIAVVAILSSLHSWLGVPLATSMASSPAGVAAGHWWQLVTSAFLAVGQSWEQAAALLAVLTVGWITRASWLFWVAGFLAHVFGTLLTYIGVGMVW